MPRLREDISRLVATHATSHGRETLQVLSVPERLPSEELPHVTQTAAHAGEAVQVSDLPEGVYAEQQLQKAHGETRQRRGDASAAAESRGTNSVSCLSAAVFSNGKRTELSATSQQLSSVD